MDEEALGLGASLDLAGVVPAGLKVRKRNEEEREELEKLGIGERAGVHRMATVHDGAWV